MVTVFTTHASIFGGRKSQANANNGINTLKTARYYPPDRALCQRGKINDTVNRILRQVAHSIPRVAHSIPVLA